MLSITLSIMLSLNNHILKQLRPHNRERYEKTVHRKRCSTLCRVRDLNSKPNSAINDLFHSK